jgi:hypothetical protein
MVFIMINKKYVTLVVGTNICMRYLTQSQQDNVLVILSEISNKDQYDSRKSRSRYLLK